MKTLIFLVMVCSLCTAKAEAHYKRLNNSTASEISAFASVIVVLGTVDALGSAGNLVVESVEKTGDVVTVVFKGMSNASRTAVKGSAAVLGQGSLAVGASVNVVTMASGFALVSAGQVIAFFPNEAGKGLIHQSGLPGHHGK